jgi:trehalose 6-phosphate synthase
MSRLVVVSNRLPAGRPRDGIEERGTPVGGLATAILDALRRRNDSVWVGWSGRSAEAERADRLSRTLVHGVDLLGLALTDAEIDGYYHGFCNQTLWPLLHCFQGKVRIRLAHEEAYRAVQARFADALMRLLKPDDLVWVHDYHLMLLGRELRRRGWKGRVGFFLHTPFPPLEMWQILPQPEDHLDALLQYDVAGFHVSGFLENYIHCCRRMLRASWDGGWLEARGRRQHVEAYPVGIEPDDFRRAAGDGSGRKRSGTLIRALRDRALILGVDRLDYTKGIPERLQAFERLVRRHEEWRKRLVFVQIASPSREEVPEYGEQRRRIEALLGRINGELGEHDWVPIRYLYRAYERGFLARLYRQADVGLVTPLRDGMNLVAKEFVAAQDPDDPGVLVLSLSAGAAQQLEEALLVNPFITADLARGMHRALVMPLEERRERHAALLRRIRRETASDWARRFVRDLEFPRAREAGDRIVALESRIRGTGRRGRRV